MSEGFFRRRRLPRLDVEDATDFVTTCLAGSIPARGLIRLRNERARLERRPRPAGTSIEQWETDKNKLLFAEFDKIIDSEPAIQHLADPRLASEVESSILHFAAERYDLLAYVVMPSHFHWLFHPRAEWSQERWNAN